jgi:hypothetical protein
MAIDTAAPRSRRALLAGVGGALAALAGQALRPMAARGEGEVIHVGDRVDTARSVTWLTNRRNANDVLRAESTGDGRGVYGVSARHHGVHGRSMQQVGVFGQSRPESGIAGWSVWGDGVSGESEQSAGVFGRSAADSGVAGFSYGTRASVYGWKFEDAGNAIKGEIKSTANPRTAIVGTPVGPGAGIRGMSEQGRGGQFGGPVAQLRLMPSVAIHPATGAMGDLVADTSGHLWFCKGGANWTQLA